MTAPPSPSSPPTPPSGSSPGASSRAATSASDQAAATSSFYRHHVFFCLNRRDGGRECCQQKNAEAMQGYAKDRVKALGLAGPGRVRVNKAGCLDRCELGPVVVVYPDNVWYTYVDQGDIDEIIESHLRDGRPVERLRLPDA